MILEDLKIKNAFSLTPKLEFLEDFKVAKINRVNTDSMHYKDLDDLHLELKKTISSLPKGIYKQITIGKKGYLKYPGLSNRVKDKFLRKMEKFVNGTWNIRERNSYLVYQDNIDENVLFGSFPDSSYLPKPIIEETENEKLLEDLAYLFGGDSKQPFGKVLDFWDYGFKIGNKYVVVLIQYNVGDKVIKYAHDYLNTINVDFLHVLHFEPMDSIEIENKINTSVTIAEKTGMPKSVMEELYDLRSKAIAKNVNLIKYCNVLFLFCDSKEEALKKAWEVKNKAPYNMAFEGDIEFEIPFILSKWDFLKGKDWAGIVRYSSIDYLTSLLYVTGRFTGNPKDYFIPMLNEALEPAYIPINRDLFNVALQGQMGSGKSVSLQYIASMFDMVTFIEKIQSDVGSYAIYCKYFDGDYIPISLEIPVSINPLGKVYQYYTVNIYELAEYLGIDRPHEYFDQPEIEAISLLIDDYFFNQEKDYLTKKELLNILENDKRVIRFKEKVKLSNKTEFPVKVSINSAKKTFVTTFLSFVYKGEDENVEGFSEIKAYIEKLLDEFYAYHYKKDRFKELLVSDFYEYAEKNGQEGHIKSRFLNRLYSFKNGGKYGHLFDKPTSIREDVEHIFFEIRFTEKDIIPIIIMTIMDFINRSYGSVKFKDKTKFVVIDEGWFFMNIPMAKDFIDEAFRTYRKRGISIGFGTQNPKDYEGMTNYLPYVWILYLEDPEEAVKVYKLTDRDYDLLRTIDKPKAYNFKYSKAYLIFKNIEGKTEKGLFLLPSYPEFRWIAETDPIFKMKRESAIRKFGSLRKAIEWIAFNED